MQIISYCYFCSSQQTYTGTCRPFIGKMQARAGSVKLHKSCDSRGVQELGVQESAPAEVDVFQQEPEQDQD